MRKVLAVEPGHRFPSLLACVDALALALGVGGARVAERPPPIESRRGSTAIAAAGWVFCTAVVLSAARSTAPAIPPPLAPAPEARVAAESAGVPPSPSCPVPAVPPHEESPPSPPSAIPVTPGPALHLGHDAPGELTASYRTDPY